LGTWFWQDWRGVILMRKISEADRPYILAVRIGLVIFFATLSLLVYRAWRRKEQKRKEGVGSDAF
ncbi:MAG: hypothetical protein PHP01_03725, partial [Phycisphaerae bacterium]|nr:hypothetical protein [Phycisphaerae bacterium]